MPLVDLGLCVPSDMDDVLINATIGVPMSYIVPILLTGVEKKECYERFGICTHATVPMADKIVSLVRKYSTASAYKVHGGIMEDGTGEEHLIDKKIGWTIRKQYRRLLMKIQKGYKAKGPDIPFEMVVTLDQSFRMKRCRRSTFVVDEYGTRRVLVWYQYIPHDTDKPLHPIIGQWFDISLSNEPPRSSMLESKEDLKRKQHRADQLTSRRCTTCGQHDTLASPFKACGHCCKTPSPTYYCSRNCQKVDWPNHKKKL